MGWPNCSFWNMAYSAVAEAAGVGHTRDLKQLCRAQPSSPILFADALPIALRNEVADKGKHRGLVSAENAQSHIKWLFSNHAIFNRVKLVILSGLNTPASVFKHYELSIDLLGNRCKKACAAYKHLPFFHGNNGPAIRHEIDHEFRSRVSEILAEGEFHLSPQPSSAAR